MLDWSLALQHIIQTMQANAIVALEILGLLWGIQIVNASVGYRLNVFGIYPRHPFGLIGIFTSPFLHGHMNHLFFNSIPLFLLLVLMLAQGYAHFLNVTLNIMLVSGLAVWLFGRKALHVGASGVIMGYMGYLLTQAFYKPDAGAIVLGILAIYYCGSILTSLLPSDAKTSWEGHVFGFAAGILAALGYGINFIGLFQRFL
ncbi:MAG: rhomboid family intramembrane serine protease [Gammaproteobacteria bacterium]